MKVLRAKGDEFLTVDQVRTIAPALFADAPHASRSDRYVYISSSDVLESLADEGFVPVEVRQVRSRDPSRQGFAKHMLRFRHRDQLTPVNDRRVGDVSAEVGLKNGHDGSSPYDFHAGLFRLACLNGMVVCAGDVAHSYVRHAGNREKVLDAVKTGAHAVLAAATQALDGPRKWRELQLDHARKLEFASAAGLLRFGDSPDVTPEQLLIARRTVDQGDDLWTTFNVVQENVIRGGLTFNRIDANGRTRRHHTRALTAIDRDINLNAALWNLADATYKKLV